MEEEGGREAFFFIDVSTGDGFLKGVLDEQEDEGEAVVTIIKSMNVRRYVI